MELAYFNYYYDRGRNVITACYPCTYTVVGFVYKKKGKKIIKKNRLARTYKNRYVRYTPDIIAAGCRKRYDGTNTIVSGSHVTGISKKEKKKKTFKLKE